jgi:DNA processing protein
MKNSSQQILKESETQPLAEKLAWLRLIRTDNVGPITFYRLMERFGSAQAALDALPELSKKGGGKKELKVPPLGVIEKEYEMLTRHGGDIVTVTDEAYPLALSACEDAPPVLSVIGRKELMNSRCVGMVGARNASFNGRKFAAKLASDLGGAGFTVVSGLARGIDTAAHQGSVSTGTIAVVAGGIDVVYPEENRALYEKISQEGLIIAESPFGFSPRPQDFPRRNRIVSGISEGVVVVEASLRSGSLITARLAAEQGRDVFAVPGFPLDPRAQGPNKLIRDGAALIESAADIVEALDSFSSKSMRENNFSGFAYEGSEDLDFIEPSDPETARQMLLENLSYNPIAVDELILTCHLTIPVVQTLLLEMELAGRLKRHPGGKVSLVD